MTKPNFVYHLTTGTFNYVVKDPNCIHLSGQLWIKDRIGISHIRVLELEALLSSVFATYFISLYRPYIDPLRSTSVACDVLANFLRLSIFRLLVNFYFHFL